MKEKETEMKKTEKTTVIFVLLCALALLSGCATAGPAAKSKASAALKSADLAEAAGIGAAAASGDYKKAFEGVVAYAKRVKAAEAKANGTQITEAEAAAALKAVGFEYSKTVFFDGIAVNDLKRITWEKKLVQTGSGADTDIEVVVDSGDGATVDQAVDPAGEVDWMDVILKQAEEAGVKLE